MSAEDSGIINTKTRILEAAENEFVEKGYAGARVDVIAKNAKINKAQLFYHFGNKENILKEVLRKNISDVTELVENNFNETKIENKESFFEFTDEMYALFKKKENIIRIIMMETFKSNSRDFAIFEILEPLFRKVEKATRNMGIEATGGNTSLISFFFLDMMPILLFITFKDKFSEYYKISEDKLEESFKNQYMKIPMRHYDNINVKINKKKTRTK